MNRVAQLLGLTVALALAVGAAMSVKPRSRVSVRVRDPSLQIFEARFIPWQTNSLRQVHFRQTWLDLVEIYSSPALDSIGVHIIPHESPSIEWETDLEYREWGQDALVLFGYRRGGLNVFGFELVDTHGGEHSGSLGSSGVSCGIPPHRVIITNEFAAVNWIPLGTRGAFKLRFHGETNVLADVTIR